MVSSRNLEARARVRRYPPVALARLALSYQATDLIDQAESSVRTNSDDWGHATEWLEPAVHALRSAEELVTRSVIFERARGTTWEQIGDFFGISKQSAEQRYGAAVKEWERALHSPYGLDDEDSTFGSLGYLPRAAARPDEVGPELDEWAETWRATFNPNSEKIEAPVTGGLRRLELRDEASMLIAETRWAMDNDLTRDDAYMADFLEWKADVTERMAAENPHGRKDALELVARTRTQAAARRAKLAGLAPDPGDPASPRTQLIATLRALVEGGNTLAVPAAVLVAQAPEITEDPRFLAHTDPATGAITWEAILAEPGWSPADALLIEAAAMFAGTGDKFDTLDRAKHVPLAGIHAWVLDALRLADIRTALPEPFITYTAPPRP